MNKGVSMEKIFFRMGMAAAPWWAVTILIFGALEPDYSNSYKAVSELGALGAANALAMNILCPLMTGAFIVLGGFGFRSFLVSNNKSTSSAWWIIIFGVMFSGTAVPADMDLYFASTLTIIHAFFVLLGVLPFFVAAWMVPRILAKLNLKSKFITYFPWMIVPAFLMHGILDQGGLVQRATIFITLFWVSYTFWFVSNESSHDKPLKGDAL